MSEVLAFLRPLGLERYHSMFEDEAITEVDLLRSMGEAMLRESMEELGMQAAHTEKLARALFPSGSGGVPLDDNDDDDLVLEDQDDDDDGLVLEDQDVANPADEDDEDDDELELEENPNDGAPAAPAASAAPAPPPPTPAAPTVSPATVRAAEMVKSRGNDALKAGRVEEAATLYGQAIALNPIEAVYYSNRSSALCTLGRFDAALGDARECARLRPDWAKAHLRVGGALSGLQRHADAASAYREAQRCARVLLIASECF